MYNICVLHNTCDDCLNNEKAGSIYCVFCVKTCFYSNFHKILYSRNIHESCLT